MWGMDGNVCGKSRFGGNEEELVLDMVSRDVDS